MDQIFAPWRIEWVERDDADGDGADGDGTGGDGTGGDGDGGCVFCRLPEREDDRETRIVARSEHSFVLLNNYPYNPGHLMVIPHHHTGDYAALSDDALLDHARLKQRTFRALEASLDPDAFNAGLNIGGGAAGGSIDDHVHTHVVPRWEGDTNFMPVISDTTVIVEGLSDTYERLHEAYAAQDGADAPDDVGGGAVRFD